MSRGRAAALPSLQVVAWSIAAAVELEVAPAPGSSRLGAVCTRGARRVEARCRRHGRAGRPRPTRRAGPRRLIAWPSRCQQTIFPPPPSPHEGGRGDSRALGILQGLSAMRAAPPGPPRARRRNSGGEGQRAGRNRKARARRCAARPAGIERAPMPGAMRRDAGDEAASGAKERRIVCARHGRAHDGSPRAPARAAGRTQRRKQGAAERSAATPRMEGRNPRRLRRRGLPRRIAPPRRHATRG